MHQYSVQTWLGASPCSAASKLALTKQQGPWNGKSGSQDSQTCLRQWILPRHQEKGLLHYLGESINDIFDTLPNTKAVNTEDPFKKAIYALTAYFAPHQNREYEVYKFRQAKQEPDEDITKFYTRLRQLASTCEFQDESREIMQDPNDTNVMFSSNHLRRKTLSDATMTLNKMLEVGRAIEMSEEQAAAIEKELQNLSVNRVNDQKRGVDRQPW